MAEYSQAEKYFGTFTSEDILTAPSSEVTEPAIPSGSMFKEISVLDVEIKEEPPPVEVVDADLDCIKIEEQTEKRNEKSSFSIKVADFARNPANFETVPNDSAAAFDQLKNIRFPLASRQYERTYHINNNTRPNRIWKLHILTSNPKENNTKTEWKLITPYTNKINSFAELCLVHKYEDIFHLTAPNLSLAVWKVTELSKFQQGLEIGENLLVQDSVIQQLTQQFKAARGTEMIPAFEYNKEGNIFSFPTQMDMLGYEGVPRINDPRVCSIRLDLIMQNMDDYYLPETMPRVRDMAILMDQDIRQSEWMVDRNTTHHRLLLRKQYFLSKIPEYPTLQHYPDILYLILKQSLQYHHSQANKPSTSSIRSSHIAPVTGPFRAPIRGQVKAPTTVLVMAPTRVHVVAPTIDQVPTSQVKVPTIDQVMVPTTSQVKLPTIDQVMVPSTSQLKAPIDTQVIAQRNLECPFKETHCKKRLHESSTALRDHLIMEHFQTNLACTIIEAQRQSW